MPRFKIDVQERTKQTLRAAAGNPQALLRAADVCAKCELGRTWLYMLTREGRFPRPVKVGTRGVRWRAGDVDAWLAARAAYVEWQPEKAAA